jgi:hypothetical protein
MSRATDPATRPTVAATSAAPTASLAFQVAAAEHLSRVDALLVEYSSGHASAGAEVQALARDLLSRTRLWIDADRIPDPRLRSLLEDLELVLVQIAQLAPAASAAERSIVDHGISHLEIRNRLRNAIHAISARSRALSVDERAESTTYLGAKRWPASSRRHWPLSIGFSTIAATSFAYSSGRPSRFGNAASLVNAFANSSGMPSVSPVANRLGAMASARIPLLPMSRAIVRHIPAMPAFDAV